MIAIERKIELAREVVNALEFGTEKWERGMEIVRQLCEKHASVNKEEVNQNWCATDGQWWN